MTNLKIDYKETKPEDIEKSVSFITNQTVELQRQLKNVAFNAKVYTYNPDERNLPIEKAQTEIVVDTFEGTEALSKAIKSYSFESKHGGITVPTKHVGVLEIPRYTYFEISNLIAQINFEKVRVKKGSQYAFPNRIERREFFESMCPGVITSTIYRKIEIVNNFRYSTFNWCETQKAPIKISDTEAQSIINRFKALDAETSKSLELRSQAVLGDVVHYISKGMPVYRLMGVRAHPVQLVTHYDETKKKNVRKSFKLSFPIITVRGEGNIKIGQLEKYKLKFNNKEKGLTSYGKLKHIGNGFYIGN